MKTSSINKKNWVKPEVQRLNINKDTHSGSGNTYETSKNGQPNRRPVS